MHPAPKTLQPEGRNTNQSFQTAFIEKNGGFIEWDQRVWEKRVLCREEWIK